MRRKMQAAVPSSIGWVGPVAKHGALRLFCGQGFPSPLRDQAAFVDMIAAMFPTVPKLEMFARGGRRPGWDT
jgi:hypothetical protein